MRFYKQLFAHRLHILIPLLIRASFLVLDYIDGTQFRFVIGSITVITLLGAYYFYHKNQTLRVAFTNIGFLSLVLSPIMSNGGLGADGGFIYIIGFAVYTLWAVGIEHARSVLLSTGILIIISIIHYYSGYAQIMDIQDNKSFLGLPLKETIGGIAILIGLFILVDDYQNKNSKLIDINTKQEHFISHLNHEIRNPLQGIKGVLDVLSHHEISASKYQFLLRNVIRTTEHLNDTIDGVLNIKQLRSNNFIDTPIPVNIRDITSKTLFIYEEQANQKGLRFDVHFHDNLPEQVFVAQKSFKIILSNIVSNAVKFTTEGSIKVYIETDIDHKNIILKVEDTGIGIPDEYTDQIFEQYFQIEQSSTKKYQGTGIGLSIVQQILNELKGTIDLKSIQNSGSGFQVTMPYKRVRKPKNDVQSDNDASDLPNLAGVSVLIVEDNFINRTILKEQLIACAVNIKEAENGEEALELLDFHHFDIVLSDIAMPKLDGLGLINKIRETDDTTPVIAITGNTMPDEVRSYYDAGFNYVLSKPYTAEKLYDVIIKIRNKQLHSFGQ